MVQPKSNEKRVLTNFRLLYIQLANYARRSRENFTILAVTKFKLWKNISGTGKLFTFWSTVQYSRLSRPKLS